MIPITFTICSTKSHTPIWVQILILFVEIYFYDIGYVSLAELNVNIGLLYFRAIMTKKVIRFSHAAQHSST